MMLVFSLGHIFAKEERMEGDTAFRLGFRSIQEMGTDRRFQPQPRGNVVIRSPDFHSKMPGLYVTLSLCTASLRYEIFD
jgi:hypothetical protein